MISALKKKGTTTTNAVKRDPVKSPLSFSPVSVQAP
jgi:hypothetical protein